MIKKKPPEVARFRLLPSEKEALDSIIKAMRKAFRKDGLEKAFEVPSVAEKHYRSSSNKAKRDRRDVSAQRLAGAVAISVLLEGGLSTNPKIVKAQSKKKVSALKSKKAGKKP